jgi:hypothetical protein
VFILSSRLIKKTVVRTIEALEGVLKITKIDCHYEINVPFGKRDAAESTSSILNRAVQLHKH